jgi:hypothetical protein
MPLTVFHEVTQVLAPGRTMTLMDIGPSQGKGAWGYLDPHNGQFVRTTDDPAFKALLLDRNPHLR